MSDGLVCVSCDEWFEVIFNTGSKFSYCPMCGYEFTEEELNKMCEEAEEEKK